MNKSIKLIFNYLLAPLLLVLLCASLYNQISKQPDLPQRWLQIKQSWQHGYFWLVFFMMFINWGLEAKKWQLLVSSIEKLTFFTAFKSVLAGCSVTMITPNRIGEYGGRIIYLQEENRLRAISVTILGSMSQLLVTLVAGCLGLSYLKFVSKFTILPWLFTDVLLVVSICLTVILALLYGKVSWMVRHMQRLKFLRGLYKYMAVLNVISGKQLLRILALSVVRYLIFILQYVVLLNVMQVEVSIALSFLLLTIFYLFMAVAPTVGFIELPVRAAVSLELFKLYSNNVLGIQAAALGIWMINLVIPAILGSILIFGIKILKER
ncbi:MAG: lysylphosphatidylglycerol synthase transmembrane domain-containing protein [Ferruginibacter sp.]